jgi:radical SAM superfamily enzyme YgiQ (UPF0313 family)
MDVSVEPFDPERAARARLVLVSVPMHTALRVGVEVIGRVRTVNPACHVAVYGLYAQLNRAHLLAHGVDSVIGGEAEAPLVALAEALESAAGHPVPGVGTATRPAAPHLARLRFPVPSRAALPSLKQYARLEREGRHELVGYLEASRGCKHLCRHCPIPPVYGGRFFVVPPDVVLADARQCVEAGATHLTLGDPDFLNGPRHAVAVARALHAAFPHVSFDFTAKVEHLLRHRGLLPELRALGCAFVVSAVESLSDAVLTHLDKGHTRADVVALVRLMREADIPLRPTWVAFTPWTTLEDYRAMLDFVDAEDLVDAVDPVQYALRLLVPPGSLLADHPAMRPHVGPLVESAFSHAWAHPDPRMDALQTEVTRVVQEGAEAHADEAATFDRVRALAAATAGVPAGRPDAPGRDPHRRRPPRLTEPWFC